MNFTNLVFSAIVLLTLTIGCRQTQQTQKAQGDKAVTNNDGIKTSNGYQAYFKYGPTLGNYITKKIALDKPLANIPVWSSNESSCSCVAELYNTTPVDTFNFSCTLPNDYRVQVSINCLKHIGEKEAISLFACQNFTIWCEKFNTRSVSSEKVTSKKYWYFVDTGHTAQISKCKLASVELVAELERNTEIIVPKRAAKQKVEVHKCQKGQAKGGQQFNCYRDNELADMYWLYDTKEGCEESYKDSYKLKVTVGEIKRKNKWVK